MISLSSAQAQDQAQQNQREWARQNEINAQENIRRQQSEQYQQQAAPYEQDAPPPPRQPFVSTFETTFGALAKSQDDKRFAFSVGRYTAGEAAAEARDKCEQQTEQACSVVRTFENACATLAWQSDLGREGPLKLSDAAMAIQTTSEDSTGVALRGCERLYGVSCRVG